MRKLTLIFAIVMALSALAFGDPKIFVPEKTWDFGHVPQNGTLSHDYWVKNRKCKARVRMHERADKK